MEMILEMEMVEMEMETEMEMVGARNISMEMEIFPFSRFLWWCPFAMIVDRIERSLRALLISCTFGAIRHQMNRKRPPSKLTFPFPGQIFPFPFPTLEMEMEMDLEMDMVGNSKYFHFLWSKFKTTFTLFRHVLPYSVQNTVFAFGDKTGRFLHGGGGYAEITSGPVHPLWGYCTAESKGGPRTRPGWATTP